MKKTSLHFIGLPWRSFDYRSFHTTFGTYAVVAEWLRRWTRNPLGSARTGSNPVGSELFYDNSSPSLSIYPKHLLPVSHRIYKRIKSRADVAEWLRRWTWNPLGSARTGSNPVVSEGFLCLMISHDTWKCPRPVANVWWYAENRT